jgi:RNA polymerase sigma-70 factor (ECF subfamily)
MAALKDASTPGLSAAHGKKSMLIAVEPMHVVRCAASRDTATFEELFERYRASACALAAAFVGDRHEAENIAQEAFLAVWKALPELDGEAGSLWGWLSVTTRNFALKHLRKHERVSVVDNVDVDALREQFHSQISAEIHIGLSDEELHERVRALPEYQQMVLALRFGDDLSFEQIAQVLGSRTDTVRQHHHRALKTLRRRFVPLGTERREVIPMRALAWPVRRARPGGFSVLRRAA